jgi:MOSC domain-containing protein YiiM
MSEPCLLHLYVSPGHNFFGRHGLTPGTHPTEERSEVGCEAGRGLVGDRFYRHQPDYKGQITFFASEVFVAMSEALGIHDRSPAVLRRNILTSGLDLTALGNAEFALQGVRFRGMGECKPCHWMDEAFGPGAEAWLRGRGGLRAKILSHGVLRPGLARLEIFPAPATE